MSTISKVCFSRVVRPLKTTFATSLGSKNFATSVIVRIYLANGSCGIGEVPTSFVLKHETTEAIGETISKARSFLVGSKISDYVALAAILRQKFPDMHMTASGVEMAMFRTWLADTGQSEHSFWGGKLCVIDTDITIPFVPEPQSLNKWLSSALRTGFISYKVKVSGQVDVDTKFVTDLHQKLTAGNNPFLIRLDGNQGFTQTSALELLKNMRKRKIDIELFEQPLPCEDYSGLKSLYSRSPVPIIVDETVFCSAQAKRVIEEKLAHGINIKIAKSGISDSGEIMRLAKQAGLKLMIGCMTETMTGLSAAINMAAGAGGFDYIDLDSIHFLHHSNVFGPITIAGKQYKIAK